MKSIFRAIGRGLFIVCVPVIGLVGVFVIGGGLSVGGYWLLMKAEPSNLFGSTSAPTWPVVAKWPLCSGCEPPNRSVRQEWQ